MSDRTVTDPTTPERTTSGRTMSGRRLVSAAGPFLGLVVLLIVAAVTTPQFYSGAVLNLVFFQLGLIGITAIGQTLVLLVGGIDLSVGGVIGLTTVIVAVSTGGDASALPAALALAIGAGALVGLVNALLVVTRQVPPFVATFAVFVLVQGVVVAWTKGAPSGNIPDELSWLGTGDLIGIPTGAWLFAGLALVASVLLARGTVGRRVYATGANRRAADLSGIRTGLVIASCYVLSSLLAVLAGLINAGYVGYVDAQLSRTLDLDSIAAAVIGGVALSGGKGRIEQTVLGAALLAVLLTWLVQLGAGAGAQMLVSGIVILGAVWLQSGQLRLPLQARKTLTKGQTK